MDPQYSQIGSYSDELQAETISAVLKGEGISAYIGGENPIRTHWLLSPAVGGVKLFVKTEDAAQAREILEGGEFTPIEPLRCPKCQSEDLTRVPTGGPIASMLRSLTQIFSQGSMREIQCGKCTHVFYPS